MSRRKLLEDSSLDPGPDLTDEERKQLEAAGWKPGTTVRSLLNFTGPHTSYALTLCRDHSCVMTHHNMHSHTSPHPCQHRFPTYRTPFSGGHTVKSDCRSTIIRATSSAHAKQMVQKWVPSLIFKTSQTAVSLVKYSILAFCCVGYRNVGHMYWCIYATCDSASAAPFSHLGSIPSSCACNMHCFLQGTEFSTKVQKL